MYKPRIAESGLRFPAGQRYQAGQLGAQVRHAHSAAAAAAHRLDDDRQSDVLGQPDDLVHVVAEHAFRSRHRGHTGRLHGLDGPHLVAHGLDGARRGSDEDESRHLHALGEVRVFGQETVAGMDRVRAGHLPPRR